jgi:hypothetical protein
MLRGLPFLFLLLLSAELNAQRTIRGRVVNETTGAAIPGSSVFITNTSRGTVSDGAGQFELLDVPQGQHDLVISSIGYETIVFPFNDSQLPLQLKIELKIKVKELANVTVEPFVEEGWDKWGTTFTENFLGYTENAARCKIKNQEAIKFRFFKKSNRLIAYSDEPLRIENKALGYNITYQLEDFELNFSERTSVFMGYSLYEEMEKDKKAWQKRRDAAFYGSLMHFMRSLFTDSLKENGFEVRRMSRIPNIEKERVKKVYRVKRTTHQRGNSITVVENAGEGYPADSVAYYSSVLKQPDFTSVFGKDLLNADSILIREDNDHPLLYFTDHLYITFKKELESEAYLKAQIEYRKPTYQRSWMYLPELKPLWVEKSGNYYNPKDLYFMGYWSWSEKMGDSLPLDFVPGK